MSQHNIDSSYSTQSYPPCCTSLPLRRAQAIVYSLLILFTCTCFQCKSSDHAVDEVNNHTSSHYSAADDNEKQRGAHVFGLYDTLRFDELRSYNIEWITIVPWGFQDSFNSAEMKHHNGDTIMMNRTDSMYVVRLNWIREAGFKVFFKPHVWLDAPSTGKWRSDIFPDNDEDWLIWQTGYRDFILRYARIAEKSGTEMFCIGTELTRLSTEKTTFWRELIKEVRQVYSGKITYAANWYKEYNTINFWDELDYIGIQAYFPLSDKENPPIKELAKAWQNHIISIEKVQSTYKRKVIFTEMGYRSSSRSAIKPWEWAENSVDDVLPSEETQANCYQVFFEEVWSKKWFAGSHFWQLRVDNRPEGKYHKYDFTPKGKLAQDVITHGYQRIDN